jgi:hypothetical protein
LFTEEAFTMPVHSNKTISENRRNRHSTIRRTSSKIYGVSSLLADATFKKMCNQNSHLGDMWISILEKPRGCTLISTRGRSTTYLTSQMRWREWKPSLPLYNNITEGRHTVSLWFYRMRIVLSRI